MRDSKKHLSLKKNNLKEASSKSSNGRKGFHRGTEKQLYLKDITLRGGAKKQFN